MRVWIAESAVIGLSLLLTFVASAPGESGVPDPENCWVWYMDEETYPRFAGSTVEPSESFPSRVTVELCDSDYEPISDMLVKLENDGFC